MKNYKISLYPTLKFSAYVGHMVQLTWLLNVQPVVERVQVEHMQKHWMADWNQCMHEIGYGSV